MNFTKMITIWHLFISVTILVLCPLSHAAKTYSPSDVVSSIEYSNRMMVKILVDGGITDLNPPQSREIQVKPMHVYELNIAVLFELYLFASSHNIPPPPVFSSTPMLYTPTDVYYLAEIITNYITLIYQEKFTNEIISPRTYIDKKPEDAYQELFRLYYHLNRLNGKKKISPSEVYAHIYRAKEDLQASLLTISKRLGAELEWDKRKLVTSIYGMDTSGSIMSDYETGKTPKDVVSMAFEIRTKLNELRIKNDMSAIDTPQISQYPRVKPIDAFLQTQFIIAELNLLKIPLSITRATGLPKIVTGKTPSDVYHEMKHINYMLARIIRVLK